MMYCPSCGNEITVELKYCNRCGANLSQSLAPVTVSTPPIKLAAATAFLGLTIVSGMAIVFITAAQFMVMGIHPGALVWIILFGMATILGCAAMIIRFWTKMVSAGREAPQVEVQRQAQPFAQPRLPPPLEPVPSITEHTTRTFAHPAYREKPE